MGDESGGFRLSKASTWPGGLQGRVLLGCLSRLEPENKRVRLECLAVTGGHLALSLAVQKHGGKRVSLLCIFDAVSEEEGSGPSEAQQRAFMQQLLTGNHDLSTESLRLPSVLLGVYDHRVVGLQFFTPHFQASGGSEASEGMEGHGPRLLVAHDDGLMRMWAHPRYIDTPPAPPPSPFAPPPAAPSASCVGWSLCATFPLGPKGPILRVSYHANCARLVYVEEVAGEGGREAPPERLRVVSRDVTLSTPTDLTPEVVTVGCAVPIFQCEAFALSSVHAGPEGVFIVTSSPSPSSPSHTLTYTHRASKRVVSCPLPSSPRLLSCLHPQVPQLLCLCPCSSRLWVVSYSPPHLTLKLLHDPLPPPPSPLSLPDTLSLALSRDSGVLLLPTHVCIYHLRSGQLVSLLPLPPPLCSSVCSLWTDSDSGALGVWCAHDVYRLVPPTAPAPPPPALPPPLAMEEWGGASGLPLLLRASLAMLDTTSQAGDTGPVPLEVQEEVGHEVRQALGELSWLRQQVTRLAGHSEKGHERGHRGGTRGGTLPLMLEGQRLKDVRTLLDQVQQHRLLSRCGSPLLLSVEPLLRQWLSLHHNPHDHPPTSPTPPLSPIQPVTQGPLASGWSALELADRLMTSISTATSTAASTSSAASSALPVAAGEQASPPSSDGQPQPSPRAPAPSASEAASASASAMGGSSLSSVLQDVLPYLCPSPSPSPPPSLWLLVYDCLCPGHEGGGVLEVLSLSLYTQRPSLLLSLLHHLHCLLLPPSSSPPRLRVSPPITFRARFVGSLLSTPSPAPRPPPPAPPRPCVPAPPPLASPPSQSFSLRPARLSLSSSSLVDDSLSVLSSHGGSSRAVTPRLRRGTFSDIDDLTTNGLDPSFPLPSPRTPRTPPTRPLSSPLHPTTPRQPPTPPTPVARSAAPSPPPLPAEVPEPLWEGEDGEGEDSAQVGVPLYARALRLLPLPVKGRDSEETHAAYLALLEGAGRVCECVRQLTQWGQWDTALTLFSQLTTQAQAQGGRDGQRGLLAHQVFRQLLHTALLSDTPDSGESEGRAYVREGEGSRRMAELLQAAKWPPSLTKDSLLRAARQLQEHGHLEGQGTQQVSLGPLKHALTLLQHKQDREAQAKGARKEQQQ